MKTANDELREAIEAAKLNPQPAFSFRKPYRIHVRMDGVLPGGLERECSVYDADGKLIQVFENGKGAHDYIAAHA